jgi:drug/metabolite transporter (DMT)-like permease
VLSYFLLKRRYHPLAVVGALVTLGGAVLAIAPTLRPSHSSNTGTETHWYAVLLFALSNVPVALSYVFKEKYFAADEVGAGLDIFYLSFCVSWLQLVLTWALVPLQSLHGFGGIPMSDIGRVFSDGVRCFAGDTAIDVVNNGVAVGKCSSTVTLYTFGYSFSGFFGGLCALYLLKHASASVVAVATVVQLPISNLVFCSPLLPAAQRETFSWFDVGGVVVVIAGFALYTRFSPEWMQRANGADALDDSGNPMPELLDSDFQIPFVPGTNVKSHSGTGAINWTDG